MLQLVYTSISSQPLTQVLIDDICEQARRRNRQDEISGILVTRGDRFLQALEGPRNTVEDTFIRLIGDPRHHALILLSRRILTRREFGDWEMQHCGRIEDCRDVFEKIDGILGDAPDIVRSAFTDFTG